MSDQLTAEQLKQALKYNEQTGEFRWLSGEHRLIGKVAGTITRPKRYLRIGVRRRYYPAHHLAWLYVHGFLPPCIDHIDGNRLNNRISNLRLADGSQNNMNAKLRSDNTSGVKGVRWSPRHKQWRVIVCAYGVAHHIGYFRELQDAAIARLEAATRIHGDFARQAVSSAALMTR